MTDTGTETLTLEGAAGRLEASEQVVSWYIRKGYKGLRLNARKRRGRWQIKADDLARFEAAKHKIDCNL